MGETLDHEMRAHVHAYDCNGAEWQPLAGACHLIRGNMVCLWNIGHRTPKPRAR